MLLAEFASRFAGAKKTPSGYQAKCPAHDDSTASLSLGESDTPGLLLVHCHAGCETAEVLGAAGLSRGALSASRPSSSRPGLGRIVAEYSYTDAQGVELYQAVRFEPKGFRQRHMGTDGKWVWSLKGVQTVLYRLPEVLKAAAEGKRVYVVEGEKDADALVRLGLCATTSPMGAGKWKQRYADALRGASQVVVIPDADEPGRAHAAQVAASVGDVAVMVGLPGPGKDASDWVAAGGTREALEALVESGGAPVSPLRVADAETDEPGPAPLRGLSKSYGSAVRIARDATARGRVLGPGALWSNAMTGAVMLGDAELQDNAASVFRFGVEQEFRIDAGATRLRLGKEDCRDALEHVALENSRNPLQEMLNALEWDGVQRIDSILPASLGIEAGTLQALLLRRWAISAVARAMKPGCKSDSMLVLVGGQGVRKSTWFAAMAGDKWFSDSQIPLGDKDAKMILRQVWVLEWAELEAMRGRAADATKAFLSSPVDTYRPPYGRGVVSRPRHCVIVGSTNNEEFLSDETGNRRFWPVRVGTIDVEAVSALRGQLWAEAVAAYRGGEQWWLEREFEEHLNESNETHTQALDPWEQSIIGYCVGRESVTTAEILSNALHKKMDLWTRADENRVGKVLRASGRVRVREMKNGVRCYTYRLS